MTVFLSGKITGDKHYKSKFMEAQVALEANGYAVLNPASLPEHGLDYHACMRICKAMIQECDKVVFLQDHKDSLGSKEEAIFAREIGKPTTTIGELFIDIILGRLLDER